MEPIYLGQPWIGDALLVNSYNRRLNHFIKVLVERGIKIEILKDICLQNIGRHSDSRRISQPIFFKIDPKKELTISKIVNLMHKQRLVYDIDALLKFVFSLLKTENNSIKNIFFVSPLIIKKDTNQKTAEGQAEFDIALCIIRKFGDKIHFYINGLIDSKEPCLPLIGEWKVIGFKRF